MVPRAGLDGYGKSPPPQPPPPGSRNSKIFNEDKNNSILKLINIKNIVVSFLLGKSVYYCMPTFRNSVSVPSSKAVVFYHCLRRWNR